MDILPVAPKILIIDDELRIRKNVSFALKREVMEPFMASTGKEGLAILEREAIDCIILDIGLPDISGIDLCKKIRQSSSVPIIFLTARDGEMDRVLGLEIGGDDYMVKPFSVYELIARIKLRLRKNNGSSIGDDEDSDEPGSPFIINKRTRTITYYGTLLHLRYYEYEILSLLCEHPGRVYSREELKERVWQEPQCCTDRAVDAHIKNIRNILKKVQPDKDPIKTHRGIGYSISRYR